jgi:lipoprotein NlpI
MRFLKITSIIFIMLLITSCESKMTKQEFSHAEAVINQERSNVFLYSVITDYYLRYGSYPESLSQLDSVFELKKNDYRYEKLIKDPFDR